MEKDTLFHRVQTMIISSIKKPKYISISTVKIADLFHVNTEEVERTLLELVTKDDYKKRIYPNLLIMKFTYCPE
ncbi:hypothetical protein ABEY41_04445 [Peribacillus butanolivorans]|uniref:PCI domain-containing protein n=1 Tax=Peribacillus butanolivorans TaxID=421767 RepID=UPI003D27D6E4